MPAMAPETGEIRDLLKQVSRSFYLTLRVLPRPINLPLSVAYLLARATDTVGSVIKGSTFVGNRLLRLRKSPLQLTGQLQFRVRIL